VSETGRAVACPSCSTGYFLPAELIGPRGARVRCPKCGNAFVVEANAASGAGTAPPGPPAQLLEPPAPRELEPDPDPEPDPEPAPAGEPAARLAEAALDALAEQSGDALARAAADGKLFAEHGREIMAAFDAWRREAGRDADPAVFRAALRARWGVDLA